MNWRDTYNSRLTSADEAVKVVKSGDCIIPGHAASESELLLNALSKRYLELENVTIIQGVALGSSSYCKPEMKGHFILKSMFAGANTRHSIWENRGTFFPLMFHEFPRAFREGYLGSDVFFTMVSPPDEHGYCSLGMSIDHSMELVKCAKIVVAEVNPNVPRTYGDTFVHVNDLDYIVENDGPILDDVAAEFVWNVLKPSLLYAAKLAKEIAEDITGIDEAMRWGYNWEMGPFELWDALGVKATADRIVAEGGTLPALVEELLASGHDSFYKQTEAGETAYFEAGTYQQKAIGPYSFSLKKAHLTGKKIIGNAGASLVDLGDGVACLEFHSPNNSINEDVVNMINESLAEVEKNYLGMVIGNQGKNFCVGANLLAIGQEAENGNWAALDQGVRELQNATMALKRAKKPVVSAPFGMTLGGGAEICLHTHAIQASSELYMGLVEVGVGLIPAGGGTKEMAVRAMEGILPGVQAAPDYFFAKRFEMIASAHVSTSAEKARQLGFLRASDRYSMNPEHIILDAKAKVIDLARNFRPNLPMKYKTAGAGVRATLEMAMYGLRQGNFISEYDQYLSNKLAYAITGGNLPAGTLVDEQYLLDLEREVFMSLLGEAKTQDRIRHMLTKGKPLRN